MTLNDLECPIHLKVHFTDDTFDVGTLWLSDSAIRMGVARGAEWEGAGGSSPTLPPCGQLTRCFSTVAELLVGESQRLIPLIALVLRDLLVMLVFYVQDMGVMSKKTTSRPVDASKTLQFIRQLCSLP